MDFNVQKKCLETRLSALSAGMLAGQGLSALARASEAQIAGRGSRASTLAGREMRAILTALDPHVIEIHDLRLERCRHIVLLLVENEIEYLDMPPRPRT